MAHVESYRLRDVGWLDRYTLRVRPPTLARVRQAGRPVAEAARSRLSAQQ
jgi:hypothetical protein